jgi:hypothetical protein
MITKNDCLSILVKFEDNGLTEAGTYIKKLMLSREPSIDVLKFIAKNRGFEIGNFYEMLRKSHNQKKSPLYTNIVRDFKEPTDIILTLSCLLTQILLYGKKLENPTSFYKEARSEEITRVLNIYFSTNDLTACAALLKLIKSDLVVMEYINERRELLK